MARRYTQTTSRRQFMNVAIAAATTAAGVGAYAQPAGSIRGFDHVALPMQNTDAMLAFYRALGVPMTETANAVSMYFGEQMINFHRSMLWQNAAFTLRAPAARPPCGDLCFVWDGTPASLHALLDRAGAVVETGPADRQGGRRETGSSTYVRDPDGNLLEFIIYPA